MSMGQESEDPNEKGSKSITKEGLERSFSLFYWKSERDI
jgi:hypothetical protein